MFDLGYKQVVINDGSVVDGASVSGFIVVEGFGQFKVGSSIVNAHEPYQPPTLGETTVNTPTGWANDQVWEVKLFIRSGFDDSAGASMGYQRNVGDIRGHGQTIVFQTALVDPSTKQPPADFNTALGLMVNNEEESMVEFNSGTFKFKPGYEGFTISDVLATKIYDKTNPVDESLNLTGEYITGTVTEGVTGAGSPKEVEASVQRATPYTRDPYGIRFGGSEVVDFDATYDKVVWATSNDHLEATDGKGWDPHKMLGYGDANTETTFKERKYVVYIKSDQTAAINLLKSI